MDYHWIIIGLAMRYNFNFNTNIYQCQDYYDGTNHMDTYKQKSNSIIDCRKPKDELIMCEMCSYFCQNFGFIINCTHSNPWNNSHPLTFDHNVFDISDNEIKYSHDELHKKYTHFDISHDNKHNVKHNVKHNNKSQKSKQKNK